MDRYVRQRTLATVGDAGQARLAAKSYSLSPGDGVPGSVEQQFLERAGARHFVAAGAPREPFAHAAAFRHQVARDFAEGAWRALDQIKGALAES